MSSNDSPSHTPQAGAGLSLIRTLGSVKLAMILLAVLVVACIIGTIAESRLDTAIAQAYIYDAPWFAVWLLLLSVNLTCSVLARYPWKRRHAGFIVIHAGIVIMLVGALVGRIWGVEGNVTLLVGEPPETSMIVNQPLLTVSAGGASKAYPLNVKVRPPTAERPAKWKKNGLAINVLEYAETVGVRSGVEASQSGPPALRVVMRSGMTPAPLDNWLVLGDRRRDTVQVGPAVLRLASSRETEEPAVTTAPTVGGQSESQTAELARERHFVFARLPEMSIARALSGKTTGIKAFFRDAPTEEAADSRGVLELVFGGRRYEVGVDEAIGQSFALEGTPWTLEGLKYLPDFRIEGKDAVSVSEKPNNPALVFELVGLSEAAAACSHEGEDCDGNHGQQAVHQHQHQNDCCPTPAGHGQTASSGPIRSGVTIYYHPDGKLSYATFSKGEKTSENEIRAGEEFQAGLADWKVKVEEVLPHSKIRQELVKSTATDASAGYRSGVLVELEKEGQKARQWVALAAPAVLQLGSEPVQVSFNYRSHPLGFGVVLDHFEVERNEGTQTPAGFKSVVRFIDPETKAEVLRDVWMNNPATFPEFFGAGLLGTSYKFSQASWNPNNLSQTTLQVLRDPGWSFKWIGSLLICCGLFIAFYLKPRPGHNDSL
jgi:hypothetical protein